MTTLLEYDCPVCGETIHQQVFLRGGINLRGGIKECAFCGEEHKISIVIEPTGKQNHYTSEEWLRTAYEVENRTMAEIAKQCAVSPMTIYRWLNVHGIETRSRGHRQA
jgi:hypothetical protein|tara:strand:+ start:205 stop:528 length:324 start_codon:yes stop_codon:yes gene_type:complete